MCVCVCVCVCVYAQSPQLCTTLCDPMDCSLPVFSVPGTLQARILGRKPFLSPEDLPNPEIEPGYPALQADSLPPESSGKPVSIHKYSFIGPHPHPFSHICL